MFKDSDPNEFVPNYPKSFILLVIFLANEKVTCGEEDIRT